MLTFSWTNFSFSASRFAQGNLWTALIFLDSRFARGSWQILISDKIRTAGRYFFPSGLIFPILVPFSIWVYFFPIEVHFSHLGSFFQTRSVSSHLRSFFPCGPFFPSDPLFHVGGLPSGRSPIWALYHVGALPSGFFFMPICTVV